MSSLYNSWIIMEFLDGCLLKLMSNRVVQTITNITKSIVKWEREFLHICISKILFIDTEKLSKMQISLQVFFKDFAGRFRITYLKNGFFWSCFWKMLLIDFTIATNLKTGLSKKCSWKILFIDFKTTTKIIYLKVH